MRERGHRVSEKLPPLVPPTSLPLSSLCHNHSVQTTRRVKTLKFPPIVSE